MAENTNTDPTVENNPTTDPESNQGGGGDSVDWRAEAEKWKALSRKHESREKELLTKLKELTEASMSDAEKAIAEAREQGKNEALSLVSEVLVSAEFEVQAAKAGVELPDGFMDYLQLSRFVSDGKPDKAAIAKYISTLGAGKKKKFADAKDLGIGQQGGSGVKQLTRADLAGMKPAEIVKAREAGQLDDLLAGKLE